MRVAAVDLGSNSTRLLVADVENGRVDELERRQTITRLGESVDAGGTLLPAAIWRVEQALESFEETIARDGVERTLAIATSAVRDARNGPGSLDELGRRFGFETRLLSGAEEAAWTFRGVTSDRAVGTGTAILDIGGGSTELTLGGTDGVSWSTSLQLGGVRLTERFLHSDPPTETELEECAAHVRRELPEVRADAMLGVAGTITTLAAIELGGHDASRTHGHRLRRDAVAGLLARLASLPLSARERVPGLEPARAPVIVAGTVILHETLGALELDGLEVSERDILHGTALAAAELP